MLARKLPPGWYDGEIVLPDRMIFDLDPGGVTWRELVEAALLVRAHPLKWDAAGALPQQSRQCHRAGTPLFRSSFASFASPSRPSRTGVRSRV